MPPTPGATPTARSVHASRRPSFDHPKWITDLTGAVKASHLRALQRIRAVIADDLPEKQP